MEVFLTPTSDVLYVSPLSPVYIPQIYVYPNDLIGSLKVPKSLIGDVCNVDHIKDKITKIIYYKTLDKWLYDDLIDVLGYLKVSAGKVELIKNVNDKNMSKDENINETKIKFIEENLLSRDEVHVLLRKFVKGTNISWCEIPKNEFFVKETIEKYLKHKMEKMIGYMAK